MMTRTYSICRRSHSDPATISKTTGNVRVQNAIVRSRDARRWTAESGDRSWNSPVFRACITASSSHRTVVAAHISDRCGQSNVTMDEHEWPAKRFEEHRAHFEGCRLPHAGVAPDDTFSKLQLANTFVRQDRLAEAVPITHSSHLRMPHEALDLEGAAGRRAAAPVIRRAAFARPDLPAGVPLGGSD